MVILGTNFDRPGFIKLMEDVNKGKIDCIVTKDLSRFGRDHIETGRYLEKVLPALNIRYIASCDGVDTKTQAGLNFLIFKLSFNDFYSQDLSVKIRSVKRRKQEKGEFIANFAPFGYKKDPLNKNHLIINEETAPIVKRIFEMYLNGYGTPKITRILNDEKVPPPARYIKSKRYENCGFKWTKSSLYRLLTSEIYIGTVVGRKSYKINHKVKTRIVTPKEDRIYMENMHEAIIDKATFEKVQVKLNATKCRDRQSHNPLKKYIYCGVCRWKSYN